MKLFRTLMSLLIFKLINADTPQFLPKCADFKPVEDENLEKVLLGRWNIVRWYGPKIEGDDKLSCICMIGASTGEEHKILTYNLVTKSSGEILNMTTIGSVVKNAVLDTEVTREIDLSGMKMTIKIHAVYTVLYLENDVGLIATCYDSPLKPGEYFQTAGILSRNTTSPSQSFIDKAEQIIESYGMNKTFDEIPHQNCQY